MKKILREIFSDKENQLSSKRIIGTISFIFSISITIYALEKGYDTNFLIYPYTFTGGLFGFGVFEKKK